MWFSPKERWRFANLSTTKLLTLLKKADPNNIDNNTRKLLNNIVAKCNSCQQMAKKPFVSQKPIPDKIVFNHEIFLDLAGLELRTHPLILHIVDRGTNFSAAKFVSNESAAEM